MSVVGRFPPWVECSPFLHWRIFFRRQEVPSETPVLFLLLQLATVKSVPGACTLHRTFLPPWQSPPPNLLRQEGFFLPPLAKGIPLSPFVQSWYALSWRLFGPVLFLFFGARNSPLFQWSSALFFSVFCRHPPGATVPPSSSFFPFHKARAGPRFNAPLIHLFGVPPESLFMSPPPPFPPPSVELFVFSLLTICLFGPSRTLAVGEDVLCALFLFFWPL